MKMINLRISILFICIVGLLSCRAQEDIPPPIEKIELITKHGIRYKFPDNIDGLINKAISKKERDIHIIQLESINDSTYNLTVYCLNNGKGETISTNSLIKKTGRYYKYKLESIPIILNTDYLFSSPNFVISHFCYTVTFTFNKKNTSARILNEAEE